MKLISNWKDVLIFHLIFFIFIYTIYGLIVFSDCNYGNSLGYLFMSSLILYIISIVLFIINGNGNGEKDYIDNYFGAWLVFIIISFILDIIIMVKAGTSSESSVFIILSKILVPILGSYVRFR